VLEVFPDTFQGYNLGEKQKNVISKTKEKRSGFENIRIPGSLGMGPAYVLFR
jgi:hypothetical protein